jgi:O-acetyl-ADP-ribose deacetylase
MRRWINGRTIELLQGDITEQKVDAIVNAANSSLKLGSGVAGAIRLRGGPAIQHECDRIGGAAVGEAVITGAGNLEALYVIHAVGPRMGEGDEDSKLAGATRAAIHLASENSLETLALPAISTGVFGFPIDRAAHIMIGEVIEVFKAGDTSLKKILFCLFGQGDYRVFAEVLAGLLPEQPR